MSAPSEPEAKLRAPVEKQDKDDIQMPNFDYAFSKSDHVKLLEQLPSFHLSAWLGQFQAECFSPFINSLQPLFDYFPLFVSHSLLSTPSQCAHHGRFLCVGCSLDLL